MGVLKLKTGGAYVNLSSVLSDHNTLNGLQGGSASEYYHLSATTYGYLTNANAQLANLYTTTGPTFDHLHVSAVAAITTAAESWVGPSATAGVYFKSGNVGIGTTTPQHPLEISAPSDAYQLRLGFGAGSAAWTFDMGRAGGDGLFHFYGNQTGYGGYCFENVDNGSLVRITNGGNVGIGTTAPGDKLEIGSFAAAENRYIKIATAGGGAYSGGIKLRMFNDSYGFDIYNSDVNSGLNIDRVQGTPSTAIFIDRQGGNVKIAGTAIRGTTEGTNHLDIFDGTAPVGTLANGCSIYSASGVLKAMDAAGNATTLTNSRTITLADNTATSFTLPVASAFIFIATTALSASGMTRVTPATPSTDVVNAGSDVVVQTGALTGSSGLDNKVTVSCYTDGKVYVENRLGSTLTWTISYFG